jgi:hypothetical protein
MYNSTDLIFFLLSEKLNVGKEGLVLKNIFDDLKVVSCVVSSFNSVSPLQNTLSVCIASFSKFAGIPYLAS